MATKKPLVMTNGKMEQLQAGDTLDAVVTEIEVLQQTADATLIAGNPVYSSATNHVNKAKADASGTINVIGFAREAINSASSGSIQTSGVLTLTTAEWDVVAGTTGGLMFNTEYYLSAASAGLITATAPATGYILRLGKAISTTELIIDIGESIKL